MPRRRFRSGPQECPKSQDAGILRRRSTRSHPIRHHDPRYYQIAVLASLVVYGVLVLDFEIRPATATLVVATAMAAQAVLTRAFRLPTFDPRSALISVLSLCLLLRTDSPAVAAFAAITTIASKFLIRLRGKHVFNPTNFGLVITILAFDRAWVSPGQWGSLALLGFLVVSLGSLVIHRAERSDVTWAFLAAWCAVVFGRALWLGDPWTIPLHQLRSGTLLVFAFFMISDPKTTPDSRLGRIVFAACVAALAGWLRYGLFEPNALLYALAACCPAVPLVDRWFPGARFAWPGLSSIGSNPSLATERRHPRCAESSP